MITALYAVAALIATTLLVAILSLTFQVIRRKIALSGLLPDQQQLIILLSLAYGDLSRLAAQTQQSEEGILVQGDTYTESCRADLWSPCRAKEHEVAKLEQQCLAVAIPKWRINRGVLEDSLNS